MAPYKVVPNYISRKDGKHYRVHVDPRTGRVIAAFPTKPAPNSVWSATMKQWLTPSAPAKVAPKPVPKPVAPAPVQTPYDSTYQMNMAQDQFNRENNLASLNRASTIDQTDTAEALRRIGQQQGQSQSSYNNAAAKNNSLLSGNAMLSYGRMNTGYQQRTNDMRDALARRMQERALQSGQIQGQARLYQQGQDLANAGRATSNAWNNRLALLYGQKKGVV